MGSALNSLDGEFASISPSLATEDGAEIPMIRFVALVESQRSIITVKTASLRKGASILQIPKNDGMQGGSPLHSLEGARKTGSPSEKIGMVEHRPQGGDADMARSADPSCLRRLQETVCRGKMCKQGRWGDLSRPLRPDRDGRHDHLGENTLAMQGIRPFLCVQIAKFKKQGVASGTFRGITFRKPHADIRESRHSYPLFHH